MNKLFIICLSIITSSYIYCQKCSLRLKLIETYSLNDQCLDTTNYALDSKTTRNMITDYNSFHKIKGQFLEISTNKVEKYILTENNNKYNISKGRIDTEIKFKDNVYKVIYKSKSFLIISDSSDMFFIYSNISIEDIQYFKKSDLIKYWINVKESFNEPLNICDI